MKTLVRTVLSNDLAWAVVKSLAFLAVVLFMVYTGLRLKQTQINQLELANVKAELASLKQHIETHDTVTQQRLDSHDRMIYGDLLFKAQPQTTPSRPVVRSPNDAEIKRRLSRLEWLLYRWGMAGEP